MQLARENAADFGWSARNCQPSRQRDFDLGEFVSPIRRSILRSRTREETSSSAVGALNSLMPYDRFYENVKSIAPGQSAVFYEGDEVIGGGIIQRGFLDNGE